MKRRLLTLVQVLLAAVVISCGIAAVACKKPAAERPAADEYYCDDSGFENLLTFTDKGKFTLTLKDEKLSGSFTLKDGDLNLKAGKTKIDAEYDKDTITFKYKEKNMLFYEKVDYTVTFNTNGGSTIAPVTVRNGRTVAQPSDPTRDDYDFLGWYSDSALTQKFDFNTKVRGNLTLYADWELGMLDEEFEVDFDLQYNGTNPEKVTTKRHKLNNLPQPERSGYTFKGWWVSMTDNKDELSYAVSENTEFLENTTLYALWVETNTSGDKLQAPVVSVSATEVSWEAVAGAYGYRINVTKPDGTVYVKNQTVRNALKYDVNFTEAGKYTVIVQAYTENDDGNDSEETLRVFVNKALARVSLFTFDQKTATLKYNKVANAEKYLITVECGDLGHKHNRLDNGTNLTYDLSSCINSVMPQGGIKVYVTAVADGFVESVSRAFVYGADKTLAKVASIALDTATMQLTWSAVENATGYTVTVTCGDDGHHTTVNYGSVTTISLKECPKGEITVTVVPYANGYVSPEAAEETFNKTSLATPKDVKIADDVVSWAEVDGAESYTVKIGDEEFLVEEGTSLNLRENDEVQQKLGWETETSFKVSVKANGTDDSLYSDEIELGTKAFSGELTYAEGVVCWSHVYGAQYYEVRVNEGESVQYTEGYNFAEVLLTKAGNNTIEVRFHNAAGDSAWLKCDVFAYTLTLVESEDEQVTVYKAEGDRMDMLPATDVTGHDFAGWYYSPENGIRYNEDFFKGGDITLYAVWTPKQITVTYNFGNASICAGGERETEILTYGSEYTLLVPKPDDLRYVFMGWYSGENGTGVQYTDSKGKGRSVWNVAYNDTVFAKWQIAFDFTKVSSGYSVKKSSSAFASALPSELTIPAYYKGEPVTEVESNAFLSCSVLKTVNLPATIKVVETTTAFNGCSNLLNIFVYDVDGVNEKAFEDADGVLVYNNQTTGQKQLVLFPIGREGAYEMADGIQNIPYRAFSNAKISSITLPNSVEMIEVGAIYNCLQLVSVTFKDDVQSNGTLTIQDGAFNSCTKLETVSFPARLKGFSTEIFHYCIKLSHINMQDGGEFASVDGMLTTTDKSTIVYCPTGRSGDVTIPASIQTIGANAFEGNTNITSLVIPIGVSLIGENAFAGCTALQTVTFKGTRIGALTIADGAFAKCTSLANLVFEQGCNVVSIGSKDHVLQSGEKAEDVGAFAGCTALENVTLPASLVTLGDYTFYGLSSKLATVALESGSKLEYIGKYAFYDCQKLQAFAFPASLEVVGERAFYNCKVFASVSFDANGKNVTLEDGAFENCTALEELYLPANIENVGDGVFAGCSNLTQLTVAENSQYLVVANGALFNKDMTRLLFLFADSGDFVIPEGVTSIGSGLFQNNTNLTTVTIGANVTEIGANAFRGSSNLATVIFEPSNKPLKIGAYAFAGLSSLTTFALPDRVTEIPEGMLSGSSLAAFTIPASVTKIGGNAFENNANLTSIVIPNTVTFIGDRAFAGCTQLRTVVFDAASTEANAANEELTFGTSSATNSGIFSGCTSLSDVTLGNRIKTIPGYFFRGCTTLEEINVPNTVTLVEANAFFYCTGLTTVTFEDGNLTETLTLGEGSMMAGTGVYSSVFAGCSSLANVTLTNRIERIPAYCFVNTGITSIELPGSLKNTGTTVDKLAVGEYAFSGCTALTAVQSAAATNDDNKVTFGNNAFSGCTSLEELNLPKTLADVTDGDVVLFTMFGVNALYNCTKLAKITVEEGGKYYSSDNQGILYNADKTALILCPVANTGNSGAITIPGSVERINMLVLQCETAPQLYTRSFMGAFAGCTKITSITFEASEKALRIGDATASSYGVFANTGLTSITLPARLTYLGKYAFSGTTLANGVTFAADSQLEEISDYAFQKTTFTTIELPAGTTRLGSYLFDGNTKLTTVKLPNRLNSVGNIFGGCSAKPAESDNTENGVTFIEDENGNKTMILSAKGLTEAEYTVPNTVKTIAAGAFQGNTNLEKITIPKSVIVIEDSAFMNCTNLKYVIFEDGGTEELTFANGANAYGTIYGKSSKDNGVDPVKKSVFFGCSALISVHLPARLTALGSGAFYNCANLEEVTFEDNIGYIEQGYTNLKLLTINMHTFHGCNSLKTLELPSTVTAIGDYAFYQCYALEKLDLPYGLEEMYSGVFYECSSLKQISIPNTVKILGNPEWTNASQIFLKCTSLTSVVLPENDEMNTLVHSIFNACTGLKSIVIPKNITTIDQSAFSGCSALETVTFNDGLEAINTNAFQNCISLNNLTFPSTLLSIGNTAFSGCSGLEKVNFNEGLKSITNSAFLNCVSLNNITLPESLEQLGTSSAGNIFNGCSSLTSITIPSKITLIPTGCFLNCTSLASVTFEGTNIEIKAQAFSNCGFIELEIPKNVSILNKAAFSNCTSLKKVTLEASNDNLSLLAGSATSAANTGVFAGCTALETADLSGRPIYNTATVTATTNQILGAYTFYGSGLTSFTIPTNITSIGNYAFYGNGLTSITIPANITSIGTSAFQLCYKLMEVINYSTSFTVEAGKTTNGYIGNYAKNIYNASAGGSFTSNLTKTEEGYIFYDDGEKVYLMGYVGNETKLVLPEYYNGKTYDIYQYAFQNCARITSVTLPSTITTIDQFVFYNSGLKSITIPATVTKIGIGAFANCLSLESVTFAPGTANLTIMPGSSATTLTSLGVFNGCTALKTIDFGGRPLYNTDSITEGTTNQILGAYMFYGCSALTSVTLPNGLAEIGNSAFYGCSALASITLPSTLTKIGLASFYNTGLTTITIPASVIKIDKAAFANSTSLKTVTFAKGTANLTIIAGSSTSTTNLGIFGNCTALETVDFGGRPLYNTESITEGTTKQILSAYIFYSCTALTTVKLSGGVRELGNYAFYKCSVLATINFDGTMDEWLIAANAKGSSTWSSASSTYIIYCTDGTVDSSGNKTPYSDD